MHWTFRINIYFLLGIRSLWKENFLFRSNWERTMFLISKKAAQWKRSLEVAEYFIQIFIIIILSILFSFVASFFLLYTLLIIWKFARNNVMLECHLQQNFLLKNRLKLLVSTLVYYSVKRKFYHKSFHLKYYF